jgi:hypothetical protein
MKVQARSRREQIRTMLADLKLPGSLEAVDEVLRDADGGTLTAAEAIERLLGAQITLRNNRRLQTAMRASRTSGREDSGRLRLLLPALDQARADRELARARLR